MAKATTGKASSGKVRGQTRTATVRRTATTLVAWVRGKARNRVISVHALAGNLPACGQLAARGNVHKPTLSPYLATAFGGHGFVVGKPGATSVLGTGITCQRCAAMVGQPAQVPPPLAARMARATAATTRTSAAKVRKGAAKGAPRKARAKVRR